MQNSYFVKFTLKRLDTRATDGSRTHVSSLEGWGNSRYTTVAIRPSQYDGRDSALDMYNF